MNIKRFINGRVIYDEEEHKLWIVEPSGNHKQLTKIDSFSNVRNMFVTPSRNDEYGAVKYQDDLGKWISDAINEKINNER